MYGRSTSKIRGQVNAGVSFHGAGVARDHFLVRARRLSGERAVFTCSGPSALSIPVGECEHITQWLTIGHIQSVGDSHRIDQPLDVAHRERVAVALTITIVRHLAGGSNDQSERLPDPHRLTDIERLTDIDELTDADHVPDSDSDSDSDR